MIKTREVVLIFLFLTSSKSYYENIKVKEI